MVSSYEVPSASALLRQKPTLIQDFVDRAFSGDIHEEDLIPFNWLLVAEVAAANAFSQAPQSDEANLDWARIAIDVYDHLAEKQHPNHSILNSKMMFKAKLITSTNAELDESIANIEEIVSWFFTELTVPIDKVRSMLPFDTAKLKGTSRMELLELRRIKNRLAVIKQLQESGQLEPAHELDHWLEIRDQLP